MAVASREDAVTAFIERIGVALKEDEVKGQKPPIERRKLRTVMRECKHRGSVCVLERLEGRLKEAGIYTEPRMVDSGLRLDDSVLFSTGPFPPDSAFFPKEKDLQRFVESCLGSGAFRDLEPCRLKGHNSGREFRLPDGRRIDLLCQERTKSGPGALVAIELKRERERGTIEQVMNYIDTLKQLYPSRVVRGIIVSGREDQVASALLADVTGYDIRWLCYHVKFEQLSASS